MHSIYQISLWQSFVWQKVLGLKQTFRLSWSFLIGYSWNSGVVLLPILDTLARLRLMECSLHTRYGNYTTEANLIYIISCCNAVRWSTRQEEQANRYINTRIWFVFSHSEHPSWKATRCASTFEEQLCGDIVIPATVSDWLTPDAIKSTHKAHVLEMSMCHLASCPNAQC